ncbi:MAG: hypothetical protein HUU50_01655 [Candidatus Brocadiae bacterium]|nr:hypothetical protein [Candidatus Brocadiia bacterium]
MVSRLLCFFIACLLMACNTCEWVSSPALSYSFDTIWNTGYQVLSKRYDIVKASKEKREIETEWRKQMSIHYLEGFRDKVIMKIEEYDSSVDASDLSKPLDLDNETPAGPQYVIKLCVPREQNRDMDNSLAPSEAEWYHAGHNYEEANMLISFIATRLSLLHPKMK